MQPRWSDAKVEVMFAALCQKFETHPELSRLLASTGDLEIVESAPHDYFWGIGRTGDGQNNLGKLLMRIRGDKQKEFGDTGEVASLQEAR